MNAIEKIGASLQRFGKSISQVKSVYQQGVTMLLGGAFSWMGNSKAAQLQIGYTNKIVYAAVNVVVGKLIEVPIIVSKEKNKLSTRKFLKKNRYSDIDIQTGKIKLDQVKALDELESHPLIDILENPNEYSTGIELRRHFWFNHHLSGDGFLWAERNTEGRREGEPIYLHSLPAQNVRIVKNENDWRKPILRYEFTTWTGQVISIASEDVMHLSKWSPNDPSLGGMSPQVSIAKTISQNEQNQIAQGAAFMNGSTGIIISSDTGEENGKVYDKLTTEQVNDIKKTVEREWQGTYNNQRTHVTNGKVEVNKLGDTLADMKLIEADRANVADVCAAFGISPILLGDMSGGTENNVKAAYKALVTNSTISDLRLFDQKFAKFAKLWYKEDVIACHDITEYTELAPDIKLMYEVFGKADFISQNEKRKLFNFDEDSKTPGMDKYLVGTSLIFFDDLSTQDFNELDNGTAKQYDYN